MSIPVWFQQWHLGQNTGKPAQTAYVNRVTTDGGIVEAIGCVPQAVWDWVAPAAPTLLLDLFPNAAAAYSLRKLRAAYSGAAVRVRKEVSLVSEEIDIGFDANGNLDTTALLSFASNADGGNVSVSIWYDQSLSNDATQTTAANQPKIVSAGSLVTENGKAAITSNTEWLSGPISLGELTAFSLFVVGKNKNTTTTNAPLVALNSDGYSPGGGDRTISIRKNGTDMQFVISDGSAISTKNFSSLNANQNLYGAFYVEGGLQNTSQNGVLTVGSNTLSGVDINSTIDFFAYNNDGSIVGNNGGGLQEVIFYTSDQSANRTGIETNINNFYSIYP